MNDAVKLRESIGAKVQRLAWTSEVANSLKEEIDGLQAIGSLIIPLEPGGWWHQYVCQQHHTELLFDPLAADATEFHCPHGCVVEGAEHRGAWLVYKHQLLARIALQAAAVYAGLRDYTYAELSKRLIVEYAAQFPLYPVHPDAQPWMLKGRAFHQALTESIWSTTLIRAYVLLVDEGIVFSSDEQQKVDKFLHLLEESMRAYRRILIHERNNAENNYTAWLNASLACVYAARGERHELEALIEAEGGFRHHLSIGVKQDQIEFEGSTYYHVFVLRAYLIFAEMAKRCEKDLYACEGSQGQSMRGMVEALAELADDQGVLPALHDGPMERLPYAREIAEVAELGLNHYAVEGLVPILREAYRQMGSADGSRCGLEALLYGATPSLEITPMALMKPRGSKLWPASGFVVGRHADNPLSFLVDFGEHGGAHGHLDKLHVTLMHKRQTLTPDFGVVPYGSTLRPWFSETASHNTVSLGGKSQDEHTGRCLRFEQTEATTYAWLQSDTAYFGCRLNRHLLLTSDWLLDWFEVTLTSEDPQSIEWWMHPIAAPQSKQLVELSFADKAIYPPIHIQPNLPELPIVGRFSPEESNVCVKYLLKNGDQLHQTALAHPGQELLTVRTPGHSIDPSVPLTALLHRQFSKYASFIHVYRVGAGAMLAYCFADNRLGITADGRTTTVQLIPEQGLLIV
ncbi:heparinase [Paenibacillus sp. Soil766]|uniref:heparinase II/III domain-containing protein n=1 Tax=Paenibacillus sp. Soil766 TaxID=1736404 RepID=UPI00070C8869|nr:heparinase II/III family protein [Paenibacillus sp. Soil766]KRE92104.1 heparinase [Paenibacillus sp. Soil766]